MHLLAPETCFPCTQLCIYEQYDIVGVNNIVMIIESGEVR
jgi:hypothetical protein